VPRRLASTRAAEDRLGFQARVGLVDGLRRLVAWWREERAALQAREHQRALPERVSA
jgi:UDP-glucose 4-epimerase